jgi:hypothetical protein
MADMPMTSSAKKQRKGWSADRQERFELISAKSTLWLSWALALGYHDAIKQAVDNIGGSVLVGAA